MLRPGKAPLEISCFNNGLADSEGFSTSDGEDDGEDLSDDGMGYGDDAAYAGYGYYDDSDDGGEYYE